MKKYKLIKKKGEGTFSEVVQAQNVETEKMFAVKCMKNSFKSLQQVNNLREIQALRKLAPHPSIVHLEEVLFDEPTGRLALVFELLDENLYDLISGRRDHLDSEFVRSIGYQMFGALRYMHGRNIFHRDIKPENILIDKARKNVKLADFGSCRSIHSKPPFTEYIATRWYRSPECLLTEGHYGAPMDVWGTGCVLFEITSLFPLFPGADEMDQINRIHKVVGTPPRDVLLKMKKHKSAKIDFKFREQTGVGIRHFIPHASLECVHLLDQTLKYDIVDRITSAEACEHKYFDTIRIDRKKVGSAGSQSASRRVKKAVSTDVRNERSSYRSDKPNDDKSISSNPKRRIRVEGGIETRNLVKAKQKTSSNKTTTSKQLMERKIINKPSTKTERKPLNNKRIQPTDKSKTTEYSRYKIGLSKSKEEQSKRDSRPLYQRLPKLNNPVKKTSGLKPEVSIHGKKRISNKYANVSSSGYGKSSYKPAKSNKYSNPSATSTLTDKTTNTSGSSSLIGNSRSSASKDFEKSKQSIDPLKKRQQTKREGTLPKLPVVQ